jgi:hypothetical protein
MLTPSSGGDSAKAMEQSFPEKLTCSKLLKKFQAFYGTQRFITIFTTA